MAAALLLTAAQARAADDDASAPARAPVKHHKAAVAASAVAPAPTPAAAPRPAAPASTSVVINLIRLLVQEGVLTQDKANTLIRQAEDEAAAAARGQVAAVPAPAPGATAAPGAPPSVRVPYIPEIVRKQIRDEVKQEVMQQAKDEHWAAPDALPEWTQRIKLSGDIRLRYEWDLFDSRNANSFINYNTLNSGNPYDLDAQSTSPLPTLDTTTDRQRMRERFRLGLDADVGDGFSVGLRLATGNTTNPVSTNQTLGNSLANDSFNLDRAFVRYQPVSWATLWAGRFANPWFSTDLVWDDDVNFDGVALQLSERFGSVRPFLTAGAFPIANTSFNFPDNTVDKVGSRDKWLYAAQVGAEWRPDSESAYKIGLAYYDFDNIDGQLSAPCYANTATEPCSTDGSRPAFVQQGNTLFAIRNIVLQSGSNPPFFEYYGLASQFRELNLTARADFDWYDPVHVVFDADFVTNLGFNRAQIAARSPVNNLSGTTNGTAGAWDGGDNAFMARMLVGYPVLRNRWEWNFTAGYKYIESDSVVDAFTDSEFHLGGTNAKGYFFGGGVGIAKDFDLSAKWYSAREVTGYPYSVDVVQLDLNGRF